jgi:hypothetical protein
MNPKGENKMFLIAVQNALLSIVAFADFTNTKQKPLAALAGSASLFVATLTFIAANQQAAAIAFVGALTSSRFLRGG